MRTPTDRIIAKFKDISAIPRCSGKEARIRRWLAQWAEGKNLPVTTDGAGNMLIRVGASAGFEQAPAIVLQGHLDMVCEKTPDSRHDFSRDPIRVRTEGEWLKGDRTSLGADNGIAVALAMALVEDETVGHPGLELLLTVDEESGLNGAKRLDPALLEGRILLNLDSETEGEFTIGCAGGLDTHISYDLQFAALPGSFQTAKVLVGGLRGGHSGIDIHRQRANANILLARTLSRLQRSLEIRILSIQGGTAHNAIPRDAAAGVAFAAGGSTLLRKKLAEIETTLKNENKAVEPGLHISIDAEDREGRGQRVFAEPAAAGCLNMLLAMPHGPLAMSTDMADLVETSSNLATVRTTASTVDILTSQRSSIASRLDDVSARIEALASLAGARVHRKNGYPPWQPDPDSPLLRRCRSVYRSLFAVDPVVTAIHAGLECALIAECYPGIAMISFGPTIENPHSPEERLHIPSIGRTWEFLTALLASYQNDA